MWPIAAWFLAMHTDPTELRAHARLSSSQLYERADRTASAWRELSLAREILKQSPDSELRRRIEERAKLLAPRVGYRHLDVRMPGDIVVEQDGVVVPTFEWGHAEPIDAGPHVWTARMGDFVFWRSEVTARDGITIQIAPQLEGLAPSDEEPPVAQN